MLDADLKTQLTQVFASLENSVELTFDFSQDEKQPELLQMLNDLRSTSPHITLKESGKPSAFPSFTVRGQKSSSASMRFSGIPGGHEFTSLIVAILNADGKGKLPDAGLASRIRKLKGPIRLRTFISLTCENCPDVVQALNQMSLLHPDFQHEMIDGAFVQSEIDRLGIQGVPSVVVNDQMIHSGRIHFLDLLAKLEDHFGTIAAGESEVVASHLGDFDVVVCGGGPAGVSAAIYSVRKGLKTALLAERMGGQVQDTKGIENMISVIYTEGPQLSEHMFKHLSSYPVQVFDQRRIKNISKDKLVTLEGGETLTGKSIIVATGAKWRELGVPGEKDYIGRGVAYCPHCDGPFYKGKKIAVVGGGNSGVEAAIDLAGIAAEVTVIEYNSALKADQILVDKLKSLPNVQILVDAKTQAVTGNGQKVTGLEYENRKSGQKETLSVDGIFVQIGLIPNSGFVRETVDVTKYGEIVVDSKGRTNVPGIYAAGDVTTAPYKQIIIAMGEGAKVALAAFEDKTYGHSA